VRWIVWNAARTSCASKRKSAFTADFFGLITTSTGAVNKDKLRRAASRTRRRIRLRSTAPPKARLKVKPSRGPPVAAACERFRKNAVILLEKCRLPLRYTRSNSACLSNLELLLNFAGWLSEWLPTATPRAGYSRNPGFTETRLRPLARRRANTARPPWVFIRVRKPCVFERRRRFGWNVRFGMKSRAPDQKISRRVNEKYIKALNSATHTCTTDVQLERESSRHSRFTRCTNIRH
jgi:hypothetical protein